MQQPMKVWPMTEKLWLIPLMTPFPYPVGLVATRRHTWTAAPSLPDPHTEELHPCFRIHLYAVFLVFRPHL